jgi:aromatic ring-opening dioxygenase LigB subunit
MTPHGITMWQMSGLQYQQALFRDEKLMAESWDTVQQKIRRECEVRRAIGGSIMSHAGFQVQLCDSIASPVPRVFCFALN